MLSARNYFPSLMLRVVISSRGDKLFLVGVSFAFDVLSRRRVAYPRLKIVFLYRPVQRSVMQMRTLSREILSRGR